MLNSASQHAAMSAHSAFIAKLYDAALDDDAWPALADETAHHLEATSSVLHLRGTDGTVRLLFATSNLRPASKPLQVIGRYWRRSDRDLYVQAALRRPMRVLSSQQMFPSGHLETTPFFNEWARHLNVYHLVGAYIPLANGAAATFAVHRSLNDRPFDEDQVRRASDLLPHVLRALDLRARLRLHSVQRASESEALARFGCAVIAVDEDGRVVHANDGGEALLREADGLRVTHGNVGCVSLRANEALRGAIARASAQARLAPRLAAMQPTQTNLAVPRRGRFPLSLVVTPVHVGMQLLEAPVVLLLLRDPEHACVQSTALMELFGMTRAEASVASRIAEGVSVDTIAATNGVSVNTVRTQLRHAMAKANTQRQTELAVIVLRSTAFTPRRPAAL